MNYEEAINFIHSTYKFGSKLGLENMRILLDLMDNPQKKLKFIHVAGTNGKGSTTAMIGSIIQEAGLKVGIYTSPYIQRFTERMRVGNEEITAEKLAKITEYVKEKISIMIDRGHNHPTEFEVVTAIAFQYFLDEKCDIVVLEVGLGGRFDATNIIESPEVAVITSISLDHTAILGDTLSKIAFEKAGIIKEYSKVILYEQSEEVEAVIKETCIDKKAELNIVDFDELTSMEYDMFGQSFDYEIYSNMHISLLGDHQLKNACVAIKAVEKLKANGWPISNEAIKDGLKKAKWAGRLEVLSYNPLFLIDGAHNEDGARALVAAIKKYFPAKKVTFIFGMLKDKDYHSVISLASTVADKFIAVTPPNERALPSDILMSILSKYCNNVSKSDTIEEAVNIAKKEWSEDSLICAFGSLYYIGEVRSMFI